MRDTGGRRTTRIVGVDIARFVALAGMVAVHVLPSDEPGVSRALFQLSDGRASALFAVLAGVSLTLVSGRRAVPSRAWPRTAAGIAARAVLIGLLGLWLGGLDSGIAVILTYYALLFLLGLGFLTLSTKALLAWGIGWVLVAPWLVWVIRGSFDPRRGPSPAFDQLGEPVILLQELLFTGYYPVAIWLGYLLIGLAIGRLDLQAWRTQGLLAGVGVTLLAAAYAVSDAVLENAPEADQTRLDAGFSGTTPTDSAWLMLTRAPHSGTTFDLAATIGSSCLVLAVCLAVGRLAPRVTSVVFGAGAMTLTLYSLHVWLRAPGRWDDSTLDVYVGQLALLTAIGVVFGALRWRGPLEWITGTVSRAVSGSGARPSR